MRGAAGRVPGVIRLTWIHFVMIVAFLLVLFVIGFIATKGTVLHYIR